MGGRDPARCRGMGRAAGHRDRGLLGTARRRPSGQLDLDDREPPQRRGDPGDHQGDRGPGQPAPRGRHTARRDRPGQHSARGHPVRLARPTGRAGSRPPRTRDCSATGGSPRSPGRPTTLRSLARLDGYRSGLERAGVRRRPGAGAVRRLPPRGRIQLRGRAARPAGLADGDLRRQRPAGLPASTRPPASTGCASPRICPSSASTSCPSRAGPRRR